MWILVVCAFLLLIAAWSTLIYLASTHAPEQVPLKSGQSQAK
jgi:hypothetical protein